MNRLIVIILIVVPVMLLINCGGDCCDTSSECQKAITDKCPMTKTAQEDLSEEDKLEDEAVQKIIESVEAEGSEDLVDLDEEISNLEKEISELEKTIAEEEEKGR